MRELIQLNRHDPQNGIYGDCHRTCIAMIMGLNQDEVPNFCEHDDWRERRTTWLDERNLWTMEIPFDDLYLDHFTSISGGNAIMIAGKSPRGTNHETVLYNGKHIDPHPDGGHLVGPCDDGYYWITVLCSRF